MSTLCITVGGGSVYEFGENKIIGELLNEESEGIEKIIFPDSIKIKNISTGD